ncbi:MAG: site-2 protease family protein [Gammaproteobacteria bacterium]|nr:site-2 protease family protein [Gammaproteobacteria bacterium]
MQHTTVQMISVWILPVLFAITVHEVAHGYVAYLLGDKTAKVLGRLTLNPIKHIDLMGTIVVPIVLLFLGGIIIGWAKPVPIDIRNLHKPRRDFALIAAAGPIANLIMVVIWAGIARGGMVLAGLDFPGSVAIYMMGIAGISINLMLAILNLLPIPMLDGGHIIASLLPRSLAYQYERIAPYGLIILLILVALGVINFVMQPAVQFLYSLVISMFGLSSLS